MGDRLNGLARLGEEVSRSLEEVRTASGGASRVRLRIVAREAPRLRRAERRVRYGRIAAALAIACIAMIAVGFALRRPERTLTFAIAGEAKGAAPAFVAAPEKEPVAIAFSDGTRVVLAPETRARISEIGPKGARLLVESGKLHADVVHTGDAKWAVEAGPFEVRVTGTSFDVAWEPKDEAIAVTLTDGSVVVTGCGLPAEGRRVARGEQLRASCKDPAPLAATAAPPVAIPTATAEAEVRKPAPPPPSSAPIAKPAPAPTPSAADLLAEADAARYAGDFDRATDALATLRRRFPASDAAASAAFELGRISFDARRDFAASGDWFDTYLRERPNGSLAREALGRALEARHRAGDAARAELLAVRYLGAYPDGPHAKLARKLATPSGGAP